MIDEVLLMNGYGLYVWSAFAFTLLSFISLYAVIKIQYNREKNKFNAFLLLVFISLVIVLSLSRGSVELSSHELIKAFLREGDLTNQIIFWELRLPRLIASLLVDG